jgi:hypothetical protein
MEVLPSHREEPIRQRGHAGADDWMNLREPDPLSLKRLLIPAPDDLLVVRPASGKPGDRRSLRSRRVLALGVLENDHSTLPDFSGTNSAVSRRFKCKMNDGMIATG